MQEFVSSSHNDKCYEWGGYNLPFIYSEVSEVIKGDENKPLWCEQRS